MSMMSRTYWRLPALALSALIALPALAAGEEDAVAAKLEEFRSAQMAANAATLTALTVPELSYSHSDARVEDRATVSAQTPTSIDRRGAGLIAGGCGRSVGASGAG